MTKKNSLLFLFMIMTGLQAVLAQKLSNPNSTAQTKALYKNLYSLSKNHVLFGHQDDLAYGVNWKYIEGRSDIKEVTNDYPALYGWDISKIEHQALNNIDGVPFVNMRQYIKQAYERGAVITISWHVDNPLSGGSSWDTTRNTVKSILPGGAKHELFKTWLDHAATFMHSLKGSQGEAIPILFRPFHELTGNWFWWGKNNTTPADFKAIWRFSVDYLRNTKKLNNIIMVYNTNGVASLEEFMDSYPGDDMVDILSFDLYQFEKKRQNEFIKSVRQALQILTPLAEQKQKLVAFAETGFEAVPDPKWWTETLWPAIKGYPLSYVLVWRNAGYSSTMKKMHYYAPYKNDTSSNDFKKFYQNKNMLFEKKLGTKKIYQ